MTKPLLAVISAFSLVACGGSDDPPTELYGATFGASQLVQLDPGTGALVRTIGPIGYQVNGLEYDHTTGKLFATTSNRDVNFPDGLIEIDRATGAGTPIGTGAGMLVMSLTVSAAGQLHAWTELSDDLVTIDKATGVATVVGDAALSTSEHGLAFDGQDRLVLVNSDTGDLYGIDRTTGAPTSIGSLGVRAHHGDFHPETGLYWGIDETAATATGPARNLRVVNVSTATVTATLPTVNELFVVTFKR